MMRWCTRPRCPHGASLYNFIHVRCGARHVVPESRGFKADELFELASGLRDIMLFAAPTMVKRMVEQARRQGYGGDGSKQLSTVARRCT